MPKKRGRRARIPPFRRLKRIIKKHIQEVAREEVKKFAWELKGELVNGILMQRFDSFKKYPLSKEWLARKRKHGLDPRVLVATKRYVNSITVTRLSSTSYEVNVPRGVHALAMGRSPKKITLRQLGAIHEFGSAAAGIPPRSHWRVILRKGRKQAPRVANRISSKATKKINRELSRGAR